MKGGIFFINLLIGFSLNSVIASSDISCEPVWSLQQVTYDSCNNLPLLTPYNDTRTNLKLLTAASGLATIQLKPIDEFDAYTGYGKVPFSLGNIADNIKIIQKLPDAGIEKINNNLDSEEQDERCDFLSILKSSEGLSIEEKQLLSEERKRLNPSCTSSANASTSKDPINSTLDPTKMISPISKQFLQYLIAANDFYHGKYPEAMNGFQGLLQSTHPWLKEIALYMQGRVDLNRSQKDAYDVNGFPTTTTIDKEALKVAETKFQEYLKLYPTGKYLASARGLLRRVYWLGNDIAKLADEYNWLMMNLNDPQNNLNLDELIQESDSKMLLSVKVEQIKNPQFLAALNLMLMRSSTEKMAMSFSDLQKQEPLFSNQKELFQYLVAAHQFYVQKDANLALKTLSDNIPSTLNYVDFSRLILRGLALEANKDLQSARKLWLSLLPVAKEELQHETIQLALAMNYEQSNEVGAIFVSDSPITDIAIRHRVISKAANPELLRQITLSKSSSIQEKQIALYTLLSKNLLQGQYKDYVQDFALLTPELLQTKCTNFEEERPISFPGIDTRIDNPCLTMFTWVGKKGNDSYECPSTVEVAKLLSHNPNDPGGLICLGEFVRMNKIDSNPFKLISQNTPDTRIILGSIAKNSNVTVFSRGEAYKTVMNDLNASAELKAYATFRSVKCYASAGYNGCGGQDVDAATRKSWFNTLKKTYGSTDWAKSLKYYW